MTTLMTRLFPDLNAAQRAADRLIFKGIPMRACTVIAPGPDAAKNLARAKVHDTAIGPYTQGLAAGNAVLVVRATYKPLGVVRIVNEILATRETVSVGNATQEHKLTWEPEHAKSVLKDHPLFLTVPSIKMPHGPISHNLGMRTVKPHSTNRPLSNKRMSKSFWPMKLISHKHRSSSVIPGGQHMSRMFWPMPLLSRKPRSKSVIPGGGFPLSRLFGARTTS